MLCRPAAPAGCTTVVMGLKDNSYFSSLFQECDRAYAELTAHLSFQTAWLQETALHCLHTKPQAAMSLGESLLKVSSTRATGIICAKSLADTEEPFLLTVLAADFRGYRSALLIHIEILPTPHPSNRALLCALRVRCLIGLA